MNKKRLVDNFISLAKITSPSKNEKPVRDFLIRYFDSKKIEYIEDDAAKVVGGNSGNLIVTLKGTNDKVVLLAAHMDTVVPCDNIQVISDGEKIYTDETSILGGDDKLGIAIMMEVIEEYQNWENRPTIRLIFSICEEIGLLGMEALDRKYVEDVDFGYVLDGGGNAGIYTDKAPYRIGGKLIVEGKEAHAGIEPENGINALLVASQALSKLKIGRIDEITTSNIGVASGGLAHNIVMKSFEMDFETRSVVKENVEQQQKIVVDIFEEVCKQYQAKFSHTLQLITQGYHISEDRQSIKYVRMACEKIGLTPINESSGGASDANILNGMGIETLVLSVGMQKVHTVKEYVEIDVFEKACQLVCAILQCVTK